MYLRPALLYLLVVCLPKYMKLSFVSAAWPSDIFGACNSVADADGCCAATATATAAAAALTNM